MLMQSGFGMPGVIELAIIALILMVGGAMIVGLVVTVLVAVRKSSGPAVVDHKNAPCPHCGSLTPVDAAKCTNCAKLTSTS